MVKIKNIFGDEYRGKQKHAVYQKRYGKQIRRLKEEHKANRAPAQVEQQRRFRVGLSWYKSLSYEEKEGLKLFLSERGISLTPQQYAIKTALDRGKVSKEVFEEQVWTTGYMEGWHAEGWLYRQKIDITSQLPQDLVDFQVRLDLDASKVGPHFRWDLKGADLRFYDDKGTKIPYWVESWDEVNKKAVVWIKVPLIQQNAGADIYMYYGNEEAVNESDGEAVFEFFDDMESTSGWSGNGASVTTVEGVKGNAVKISNRNWSYPQRSLGVSLTGKYVLEFYIKAIDVDGSNLYFGWQEQQAGAGSGIYSYPHIMFEKNTADIGYYDGSNPIGVVDTSVQTWYRVKVICETGTNTAEVEVYDTEGNLLGSFTATYKNSINSINYIGSTGYYDSLIIDEFFIRKYAEQEPTAEFSSEEYSLTEGWATVQVEHIIVEHSGMQRVIILDENGEVIKEFTGLSDIKNGEIATRLDFKNDTGKTVRTVIIESVSGVLNKWTL